jgi:hypothetical protein
MATKAEQFRSNAQRKGRPKRKSVKKLRKAEWSREKAHAGAKATHALEDSAKRPSRVSTRSSANRAKSDAALDVTEEVRKGTPEQRARKARVRARRVRGSTPQGR